MTSLTKLTARCRHCFDARSIRRGELFFYGGSVELVAVEQGSLDARVTDSVIYDVFVDWTGADTGSLAAYCSCRRFAEGSVCEHIWATLLEIDRQDLRGAPGAGRQLSMFDEQYSEMSNDLFAPEVELEESSPASPGDSNGHWIGPSWRDQLRSIQNQAPRQTDSLHVGKTHASQLLYVVNAGASVRQKALILEFYKQDLKKNGEWGKPKRFKIRNDTVQRLDNPEDQQLLQIMMGGRLGHDAYFHRYYSTSWESYSYCAVPAGIYEFLLPRLAATGRFQWLLDTTLPIEEATPLSWDDGPPWSFQVSLEADDQRQCWKISGHFCRDDEAVSLREVVFVHDRLVMFSDRLARLEETEAESWISVLQENQTIEVPYRDRTALLDWLWSLPWRPEIELPEQLRPEEVCGEPQGHLSIIPPRRRGEAKKLLARVRMEYGDESFTLNNPHFSHYDAEHNRVVQRNREAEQRLLDQLPPLGIHEVPYSMSYRADVQFDQNRLPEIVRELTAAGWVVESQGQRIRRPGSLNLSVTSAVDWFELDGQVDFEGVSASLPSLLAALRSGERYVRLDDGSQGMLPEEWLEKYGRLAQLGETDGDSVRFGSNQALLLDSLLAEQDNVQFDKGFRRLRKKLKSFGGIKSRSEPRGFHGQLRGYQQEGLGWLHFLRDFNFGGCLADDMGLGKTIQVLALLQSRRARRLGKDERRAPSIVVVPKSLVFNWIQEAERFTPRLRVANYTGIGRSELLENLDQWDVLVTTYGTLRRDIVTLKDIHFDYAILDESQAIKNHNSQAAKACRLLSADHRLAMTGTPVENHLGELWSLFEFLNPGMLGRSSAFEALSKSTRNNGDGAASMLGEALRPFLLRRTKEQVLTELPEKSEQTLHCELSPKERKYYNELLDYYRAHLNQKVEESGLNQSKMHVLEALLRLRQAACHPGLIDKSQAQQTSAKLDSLLLQLSEVIEEGHKAIVFSQFTSLLSIVKHHLDRRKMTYEYLDGSTRNRGQRVQRFQEDPDCSMFLISLKAGGHGLNLTAADYVFILDPWWNPAVEAQAIDRAHRIGQTRHVFAYRLIARDTVEDRILELQNSKRELADAIVSADDSLLRNLTAEDLTLLLS